MLSENLVNSVKWIKTRYENNFLLLATSRISEGDRNYFLDHNDLCHNESKASQWYFDKKSLKEFPILSNRNAGYNLCNALKDALSSIQ